MTVRTRMAAILAPALLIGLAPVLASATSPPNVSAGSRLSSSHPLKDDEDVYPVAGSSAKGSEYAIYARYHSGDVGHLARGDLIAVNRSGHQFRLGDLLQGMYSFSMSGNVLTVPVPAYPPNSATAPVYWWRLSHGKVRHGVASVPSGDTYLAAAADGWILTDGVGTSSINRTTDQQLGCSRTRSPPASTS